MNYFRKIFSFLCLGAVLLAPVCSATAFAAAPATQPVNITPPHWIGVMVQKIPPVYSALLGLNPNQGLLVLAVIPHSPAAKAGLAAGDLLIQINNRAVTDPQELVRAVNLNQGGKIIPCALTYISEGRPHSISIVPEIRPANISFTLPPGSPGGLAISTTMPAGNIYIQGTPGTIAIGPGVILHLQAAPNSGQPSQTYSGVLTIRGPAKPNSGVSTVRVLISQEFIENIKKQMAQLQAQIDAEQTQFYQLKRELNEVQAAAEYQPPTTAPSH
jgi:membrane-associated protease RseP (regulator of RpoE activity)